MSTTVGILPTTWTPIATRAYDGEHWVPTANAPLTIKIAHKMEHDGAIFMAQRRDDARTRTELVVKRRAV